MNPFLKTYTFTFETLAPIFIGNGHTISKKEYLYERSQSKIYCMDIEKMYRGLLRKGLGPKYEQYLLTKNADLFHFLKDNNIGRQEYLPWVRYVETVGDSQMDSHSIKDICEFIKDPYGNPYIPGSSLKGALRTALENAYFLRHPGETRNELRSISQAEFRSRTNYLRNESRSLEIKALHHELFPDKNGQYDISNIVNDILRGFNVSDSMSLKTSDLCICQKIDQKTNGDFKKLNLVRECIKPGVTVTAKITIDDAFCPFTDADILHALTDHLTNMHNEFISKFRSPVLLNGNNHTFFLGGGSGYVSKTVTYSLQHGTKAQEMTARILNDTLSGKNQRQHHHLMDPEDGASPHMLKCTMYNDKIYQMGACNVLKIAPCHA